MNLFRIIGSGAVLPGLLMIAGIEVAAGQAQPPVSAIVEAVGMQVQTHPMTYRVDLRAEVELSMFRGTIEAVDPSESSITIRTDVGHTLILFSLDCRAKTRLKQGDRVLLEPDAQDTLTVKAMNRPAQGESQNLELGDRVASSPGRCVESSL